MQNHRLQILLDEVRYRRVSREARRRGMSVAAVIRQAIDLMPAHSEVRRRAIAAMLDSEPMPVPSDPSDLRRELDAAHDRMDIGG